MKKVACLALAGAFGLFGCGGGGGSGDDDDDIVFQPDASTNPTIDAGGGGGECNPVAQTGCQATEKCAIIVDQLDPFIGHVGCTTDGTVDIAGECTEAAAVGTSDNCKAGGECYNGTCHQLCTTVNDTCGSGTCQTFVDSMGNPTPTEICLVGCDPLDQGTCPVANEGCYIARDAVCVATSGGGAAGAACTNANSCDPGLICIGSTCHQICGDFTKGWNDDGADPPQLTWPNCCSSECTAMAVPCTAVNQMCMFISDGTNIVHETAGWCAGETEAFVEGIDCSCSGHAAGEDKCVDNRSGARSSRDSGTTVINTTLR